MKIKANQNCRGRNIVGMTRNIEKDRHSQRYMMCAKCRNGRREAEKKQGAGKCNWGKQGDEVEMDFPLHQEFTDPHLTWNHKDYARVRLL